MEVVVFGAGSLGSLVGGVLAIEHAVTLVGREDHVSAITADGLRVTGELETRGSPNAVTSCDDAACPSRPDLAIVTVKAYDTATAAAALGACTPEAVLSLQNGLDNEATLANALDAPVLAGTCTYGARLVDPGHVECTGVGAITLGPRQGGDSALADAVGTAFDDASIRTTVAADMPAQQWEKLAVNAAINPVTALARVENGALADGPTGAIARQAVCETATVARANGIALGDDRAVAATKRVIAETAAHRSSMLQDVTAGRRTEIDAINGAVVDHATAIADVPSGGDGPPSIAKATPVNATLAALVRAWEAGRDLR